MDMAHPYTQLTPETVIDAVESTGCVSDLRIYPLNSYENRVYQVGIEGDEPLIVKFYRPGRWSDAQIAEEHEFALELDAAELPVVPPLCNNDGRSLFDFGGFRFALYPRRGGHAPALDDLDNLFILGRLLGRIHALGAQRTFIHRPAIDVAGFGRASFEFISEHFIPAELDTAYVSLGEDLLARLEALFDSRPCTSIRLHGDCHVGNILWRDGSAHFVDLDDSRNGPAVQDLWMFLSGERPERTRQISELVEGYNEFYDFDARELALIEGLRSLRIMHYAAWLARRWEDPAFPRNFPWFNTQRYWAQHILELREQLALLDEPTLELM